MGILPMIERGMGILPMIERGMGILPMRPGSILLPEEDGKTEEECTAKMALRRMGRMPMPRRTATTTSAAQLWLNELMELHGKIALVTGGARRVGRVIAISLANAGADIALHFGRSQADAERTADELRATGARVELFQADLADPGAIAGMFADMAARLGRLDVLVNNAAVYHHTPIETLTAEQWDAEMAVNARAPALCIRHALPLLADGGAIVNIADIAAEKGWPGYPAYCASKAAVIALTKSTAKALAERNIRVNAVSPGVAIWAEGRPDENHQAVLAQVPMRRPGSPEDIAAAVLFVIGNDYITAQNLRVDGGWQM